MAYKEVAQVGKRWEPSEDLREVNVAGRQQAKAAGGAVGEAGWAQGTEGLERNVKEQRPSSKH